MKFLINYSSCKEGASSEFFDIVGHKKLGFKQFRNKQCAIKSYNRQSLLSKYNLAPLIYSKIIKKEAWGYLTEKALVFEDYIISKFLIQNLVDLIFNKTRLKFWDSHYSNIGSVTRNNKTVLVCIDTGEESFDKLHNSWGLLNPGPICKNCNNVEQNCDCYFYEYI